MKITALYFLGYPDSPPEDPTDACSEVYVEIGQEDGNIENFESTYLFKVYTVKYLEKLLCDTPFLIERSTIIVNRFEPSTIEDAIKSILDEIDIFGLEK
jgi:hypothetical protein